MAWFKKTRKPIASSTAEKPSRVPEGLWVKCPGCSQLIYNKDLEASLNVCPKCAHHFRISATERLKALFDESQVILNPVVPNPTDGGRTLIPYVAPPGEPPLTVGGELNKVASNISQGRNIAGVHWRTDASESSKLGEAATISILEDARRTYNEPFDGFTFTKFDGTRITV